MKSLRAAPLLVILICAFGSGANADTPPQPVPSPNATPIHPADFGTLPSGQVPILYNDHTVYAKPDTLQKSRVLAAFIRDHQIYVPLRSMFEQMGATVTASADGKTFVASKPGTTVSVRLGSSEVTINGEARPLDVPPILYDGVVLVPIRVISEALGAYVLWVAEKRLVVVRYITEEPTAPPTEPPVAPPPPTPPPTPEPTLVPTPVPTVAPTPEPHRGFIEAAFSDARNYNEFASGQYCPQSYLVNAGYAFKNSPFAVKLDYRMDAYVTNDNATDALHNEYTRFATIDGGFAQTPVFLARQTSMDERLEFQVAAPRIYVGAGYLETSNNYGYPHLSGAGFGVEKFPDLRPGLDLFGSAFYYPTASGDYTVTDPASSNVGKTYRQEYAILKYAIGLSLIFKHSPIYLHGGYSGDTYTAKQNAPVGQSHAGPYIGLGARL